MKDPHAPYRLTLQGGEPPGWRTTSHPTEQLIHHRSLQLVDGSILVFTGNKAEVFDPHSELWQRTEEPKHRHGAGTQALTLRNERVIVVSRGLSEPQSQCEFYYADQRQWKKLIDGPKVARAHGQLTELHDGRVLASGGALFGKSPTELAPHASCELFDPKTFVWTEVEPMNHPRFGHQAVALQDGSILVVGGQTTSIERWHPESGWDEVGALPGSLYGHQILLVDEHVFIVGGTDAEPMNLGDARITYNSSYLVDTSTYAIEEVADMRMPRHGFSLLRLANGDVLALGGYDGFNALTSCELWDLDSQIWRDGPSLNHPKHDHTALVMSDNRVLIIDAGHTEVWNPHAKTAGTDLSP